MVLVTGTSDLRAPLRRAVADYRRRFDQDSVLWLERVCAPGLCRVERGASPLAQPDPER